MTRSLWKGPFVQENILKKVKQKETFQKLKIWSRGSVILHEFIDHQFEIHNGKIFSSLLVTEDMIGHKFGEFSRSRKQTIHKITASLASTN